MATHAITFAAYDRAEFEARRRRLDFAPAIAAYTLLRLALHQTKDKPSKPEKWTAWKLFARLQDAFDAAGYAVEKVLGQDPRTGEDIVSEVWYPKAAGAVIYLEKAELDELRSTWEAWCKDQCKNAAQQIVRVFAFLETNVRPVTPEEAAELARATQGSAALAATGATAGEGG